VALRPDFVLMAEMATGQRVQIGDGTGTVPEKGDFIDIRDQDGAILRLEVFERVLDTVTPDGPVWRIYVRKPALPVLRGRPAPPER
jgi:hypothetical protein